MLKKQKQKKQCTQPDSDMILMFEQPGKEFKLSI